MKTQTTTEPNERRLLKPAEFAESIGISKRRCQNLLSARQIPGAVRIPKIGWRINYSLFLRLIEENTVIPKWPPRAVNV